MFGDAQRFWNRTNQLFIAGAESFLHQSGISPDKVHAAVLRSPLQRKGEFYRIAFLACRGNDGDWGDGNPFIDDGNSIFPFNIFTDLLPNCRPFS